MEDIKKAIIPIAGLATRFLPISKSVSKEFLPLADLPLIYYNILEAKKAGIKEIAFVVGPKNKKVLEFLKQSPVLEKILKERKKDAILAELKECEDVFKDISFTVIVQKSPLGDGHAVLQAAKFAAGEPVVCMFGDDIFDSKVPAVSQLIKVFKTCQKPIIGLCRVPKEEIYHYGCPAVEKIANRIYKIKKIVEKPAVQDAPSDLAIIGRYIITSEVFDYLKKSKKAKNGEVILADMFNNQMLKDGKLVYGCELDGMWLQCGNKVNWLKSNIYFSLNHPKYGKELREYIKNI
jgi:UTP--glucose-1-phosphate uridylyltransferase